MALTIEDRAAITQYAKDTAARLVRGDVNFVECVMLHGGVTRAEGEKVLAVYRRLKVIKTDAFMGTVTVKHGAFLDREPIRNALAQHDEIMAQPVRKPHKPRKAR